MRYFEDETNKYQRIWSNDNSLIVEEGLLIFAFTNGKAAAKGKYLLIWKREKGKLEIFRDTFFEDKNEGLAYSFLSATNILIIMAFIVFVFIT